MKKVVFLQGNACQGNSSKLQSLTVGVCRTFTGMQSWYFDKLSAQNMQLSPCGVIFFQGLDGTSGTLFFKSLPPWILNSYHITACFLHKIKLWRFRPVRDDFASAQIKSTRSGRFTVFCTDFSLLYENHIPGVIHRSMELQNLPSSRVHHPKLLLHSPDYAW